MAEDTLLDKVVNAAGHPRSEGEPTDYFPIPRTEPHLFEIGLVLGGTGATGPYTAGVLDFLVQALDAWDTIRIREVAEHLPEDEWTVPHHQVRLRIITGTSGGGISSLLTARALHYEFPPAVDGSLAEKLAANPYYDIWVNDIKIDGFLNGSDLNGDPTPPVVALLNGHLLETIADKGLSYPSPTQEQNGATPKKPARTYVNNPLPVIVTHTNLTGIPYRQPFVATAVSAEYFTNHADFVRIYFEYPGLVTTGQGNLVPHTMYVVPPATTSAPQSTVPSGLQGLDWDQLSQFALGTAAIPAGLPAREIARNGADYSYRLAWDTVAQKYSWLTPDWGRFEPASGWPAYRFVSLDGGCTDNEPVALARQTLEGLTPPLRPQHANTPAAQPTVSASGISGTATPWKTDDANRAIVLVDPLCEIPHNSPDALSVNLTSTLPRAVDMFKQTNRFATADICDFLHPAIHNRFLVAPKSTNRNSSQPSWEGGDALCGEGLGAFLGFMSRDFRHHDFMLGRYNCQAFLEGTFTLAATNPVFVNKPDLATRAKLRLPSVLPVYDGPASPPGEYPIIPLCGSALDRIKEPDWPTPGCFNPESIHKEVTHRAGLVIKSLSEMLPMNWLEKAAFPLVLSWMAHKASKKFDSMVRKALSDKNL